jgi:hypothetical protein
MGFPVALSTLDKGNGAGPSRYVADRLRARVERIGLGFEAERELRIVSGGAGHGGGEA